MTESEANAYMIGYFKRSIKEHEELAQRLETLAPYMVGYEQQKLMKDEAKTLREQIARLKKLENAWPRP